MHLLALLTLIFYILACVLYTLAIALRRDKSSKLAWIFSLLGFITHTVSIFPLISMQSHSQLDLNVEYYFFLAWMLCFLRLINKTIRHSAIFGAWTCGTAALFLASSSVLAHRIIDPQIEAAFDGSKLLLALHILPAFIAELCLVFAALISTVFLVRERKLKRHEFDPLSEPGPSLTKLDQLNQRFVLFGFVAMSVAVLSGSIWSISIGRALIRADLTEWCALISWALLAVILALRATGKWSAKRLCSFTIITALTLLLTYLLVVFLISGGAHAVA